jgi:hypothetical protein
MTAVRLYPKDRIDYRCGARVIEKSYEDGQVLGTVRYVQRLAFWASVRVAKGWSNLEAEYDP